MREQSRSNCDLHGHFLTCHRKKYCESAKQKLRYKTCYSLCLLYACQCFPSIRIPFACISKRLYCIFYESREKMLPSKPLLTDGCLHPRSENYFPLLPLIVPISKNFLNPCVTLVSNNWEIMLGLVISFHTE